MRPSAGGKARQTSIPGKWGIPLVTFNGEAGGLSHDGRLLVLSMATGLGRPLRAASGFVTVDTRKLEVIRTIKLRGDFAFDALSPNGRTLYLIEHFSTADVLRYRVRAYDLKTGRLLPQVIVDKREPDEPMSGMPSARVSTVDGRKVFTLYVEPGASVRPPRSTRWHASRSASTCPRRPTCGRSRRRPCASETAAAA